MLKLVRITVDISVEDLSSGYTIFPSTEYVLTTLLLDPSEIGTRQGKADAVEVATHMFTERFRQIVESEPIMRNLMNRYDWIAVVQNLDAEPM